MNEIQTAQNLDCLVGGTPLLRISCLIDGDMHDIFAKLETVNLTGSIKDRMALLILGRALETGAIQEKAPIYEASSGNTGISIAAIGRALGHPVRIYMPDWLSKERLMLMEGLGAEVIPISRADGGFLGAIAQSESDASRDGAFLPRQFANADNTAAHFKGTGPEILRQLDSINLTPTHFVAGVGTGGTVMGVGSFLKTRCPDISVHPLEPANSPTMRTGERNGNHRIQGISDEFVPQLLNLDELDDIVDVWDGDAIIMAQRIAKELGLGVGISSGANFLGAAQLAQSCNSPAVVATIFADSNKKYLSTDLWHDEPVKDHYFSKRIELLGFHGIADQR